MDDLKKEIDMSDSTERRRIALEYLYRVADDIRRVARQRVYYVKNAREHGATNQEIATALDITESAVRQLIKRHGGV